MVNPSTLLWAGTIAAIVAAVVLAVAAQWSGRDMRAGFAAAEQDRAAIRTELRDGFAAAERRDGELRDVLDTIVERLPAPDTAEPDGADTPAEPDGAEPPAAAPPASAPAEPVRPARPATTGAR